jgi:hypothetical protein
MTLNQLIAFAKYNNISFDSEIEIESTDGVQLGSEAGLPDIGPHAAPNSITVYLDINFHEHCDDSDSDSDSDCYCGEFDCNYCGG